MIVLLFLLLGSLNFGKQMNFLEKTGDPKIVLFINSQNGNKKRLVGKNFQQDLDESATPNNKLEIVPMIMEGIDTDDIEVVERYQHNLQKNDFDSNDEEIAKVFWDVNLNKPPEYWDAYKFDFENGNITNYEILQEIGTGGFSEVNIGKKLDDQSSVILKRLKPGRTYNILKEIQILQNLKGAQNVVQLIDAIRDKEIKNATIVYEFMNSTGLHKKAYHNRIELSLHEIKCYMYQMFKALNESHSRGIMHRDVKMPNMVIDENNQKLLLIDWGISDYYYPKKEYSTEMGTIHYKAPELLLHYRKYDYGIDIWAGGCVLAELLLVRHPIFAGNTTNDMIRKIVKILGYPKLKQFIEKYDLKVHDKELLRELQSYGGRDWKVYVNDKNRILYSEEGFDLLGRILIYDFVYFMIGLFLLEIENQCWGCNATQVF